MQVAAGVSLVFKGDRSFSLGGGERELCREFMQQCQYLCRSKVALHLGRVFQTLLIDGQEQEQHNR